MPRRILTALAAALSTALSLVITVAAVVIPLSLLWFTQSLVEVSWRVYWRAAGGVWTLAHGVPYRVDEAAAALIPASQTVPAFTLSLVPLGLTAVVVWMAYLAGRRFAAEPYLTPAWLSVLVVYGAGSSVAAALSQGDGYGPDMNLAIVVPALIYTLGFVAGSLRRPRPEGDEEPAPRPAEVRWAIEQWRVLSEAAPSVAWIIPASLRAATSTSLLVLGAGALALAAMLAGHLFGMVNLYQSLHIDLTGSVVLTLAQLAYLPNLVVWSTSWMLGTGFHVGTTGLFTPFDSAQGTLPAIPVFAALPAGAPTWTAIVLAVPAATAFAVAFARSRRVLVDAAQSRSPLAALAGFVASAATGVALVILVASWASAGSLGPGSLAQAGPRPWLAALAAWGLTAVGAALGLGLRAFLDPKEDDPAAEPRTRASAAAAVPERLTSTAAEPTPFDVAPRGTNTSRRRTPDPNAPSTLTVGLFADEDEPSLADAPANDDESR